VAAFGQDGVFQVLSSPEMQDLLRRSRRECMLHEVFLTMPQPSGWSPDDTWKLIKAIRREYSIETPIRSPQGFRFYYFLHQDLLNRLFDFERYCRPESDLHAQLIDREGQPFLVRIDIEEAIATSRVDGVSVPYRQAESLIRLDRKPRDGGERVIVNTYRAMSEIHAYVNERFTPELLWEFYRRITDGVDPATVERMPINAPLEPKVYHELAGAHPDRHLVDICAYANHDIGDPDEHPAIRAFVVRGEMRRWLPLPDWNGNVASLVYRLYCLKHQYPVLAYLPFSRVLIDWQEGRIRPPHVLTDRVPSQYVDENGDEDHTPAVTLVMQLAHHELLELLNYTRVRKLRDERMLAALQSDPSLNHRQRSILSRAIRHPDAEFNIRYHRINHNIAYATARADLLGLAEKGYLVQQQRKKAFLFRPQRDLQTRLRPEGDHQREGETALDNDG
jgi:Fic family protein